MFSYATPNILGFVNVRVSAANATASRGTYCTNITQLSYPNTGHY